MVAASRGRRRDAKCATGWNRTPEKMVPDLSLDKEILKPVIKKTLELPELRKEGAVGGMVNGRMVASSDMVGACTREYLALEAHESLGSVRTAVVQDEPIAKYGHPENPCSARVRSSIFATMLG
jgi:hypothetical protein